MAWPLHSFNATVRFFVTFAFFNVSFAFDSLENGFDLKLSNSHERKKCIKTHLMPSATNCWIRLSSPIFNDLNEIKRKAYYYSCIASPTVNISTYQIFNAKFNENSEPLTQEKFVSDRNVSLNKVSGKICRTIDQIYLVYSTY